MVRLRSLGECLIELGGVRVDPESEVLFALLLHLVVERGRRVPRARLVELCWPGEPDERARHNLRQALYKAKQLGAPIVQEGSDVLLPAAAASADYDALLAEPTEGASPVDGGESLEFLPAYRGGLSEALAEWVDAQRSVVHAAVRRHLVARLAQARRYARWSEVDRLARRCLALDAMNEDAVIALAEATAVTGSRAMAAELLDRYLTELGADAKLLGRPARELRRRILEVRQEGSPARSVFVGREEEVGVLAGQLERTRLGDGGAVLLSGPAGIGKSRLLSEMLDVAELRGFIVARAFCQQVTAAHSLGTFAAVVESLLVLPGAIGCSPEALQYCQRLTGGTSDLASEEGPGGYGMQFKLQQSVAELLQALADEAPLVIAIEDAHWADSTSVQRLAALVRRLGTRPILFIFTSRTNLAGSWPEDLRHELRRVDISGLSAPAAAQILRDEATSPGSMSDSYVDWCVRVSEGNPFYLRELLHQWERLGEVMSAPASLQDLLEARISRLSAPALRVTQYIALLARHSTLARVERLAGVGLTAFTSLIEELEQNDLVRLECGAFLIRHELLGEAALARLSGGAQRLLHKSIAQALEADPDLTVSAALAWRCAEHWIAAGELRRAGAAVRAAAKHLMGLGLPSEATSLLREYLKAAITGEERRLAFDLLVEAEAQLGRWRSVLELSETARRVYDSSPGETGGHDLSVLEAAWRAEGLPLRELLQAAEARSNLPTSDPEHRLRASTLAIIFADDLFDGAGIGRVYRRASKQFPLAGASDYLTLRLHLIYHSLRGNLALAVKLARRSITAAEAQSNPLVLARALRNSLVPLRLSGNLDEAATCGRRALDIAENSGVPDAIMMSAAHLSIMLFAADDGEAARPHFERAVSCLPPSEPWNSRSMIPEIGLLLDAHNADFEGLSKRVADIPLCPEPHASRYANDRLAGHVVACAVQGQRERLASLTAKLLKDSRVALSWGGQDFSIAALIFGLRTLCQLEQAEVALRTYAARRRERYAYPKYFKNLAGTT